MFSVTLKVCVPPTNAALGGSVALASLDAIPTMSVSVFFRFQFASTALTVTLNATPTVCDDGVPVLPEAVPGAAVSPGTKSWSFVNGPALTIKLELAGPVVVPSLAVIVVVCALLTDVTH